MIKEEDLPYVFDLLWDIKTEEDLIAAYLQKQSDLSVMKHYMDENGIKPLRSDDY